MGSCGTQVANVLRFPEPTTGTSKQYTINKEYMSKMEGKYWLVTLQGKGCWSVFYSYRFLISQHACTLGTSWVVEGIRRRKLKVAQVYTYVSPYFISIQA